MPPFSPSAPQSASQSMDLHQVGGDQRAFIDVFGERVLPQLRR
jgi:hypothetical protein